MMFKPWLRRYPVCGFFAVAFAISWDGILIVMGITDFDLVDLKPLHTGPIIVLMLPGARVSGLALTAVLWRRTEFRRLWARTARWRVGLRRVLVALMTMPLLSLAALTSSPMAVCFAVSNRGLRTSAPDPLRKAEAALSMTAVKRLQAMGGSDARAPCHTAVIQALASRGL